MFKGRLSKLSLKQALVIIDDLDRTPQVAPLTNIKLNLIPSPQGTDISEDVYAKVLETPAEAGSFYIYFTAKPPAIANHLDQLYHAAQTLPSPA